MLANADTPRDSSTSLRFCFKYINFQENWVLSWHWRHTHNQNPLECKQNSMFFSFANDRSLKMQFPMRNARNTCVIGSICFYQRQAASSTAVAKLDHSIAETDDEFDCGD